MNNKLKNETIIRNILIILTFISLIITMLNVTYFAYQSENITIINNFLINYINNWVLWLDNILLYIFAIIYLVLGIKSQKEVPLKVAFSIFSILTTMLSLVLIINLLAELFKMF